ncbi:hypothetical protein Q6250_30050, partial [Klebsiella pneumoniae]|nr:hypothetical protein [Klebsiella pneumoniae]
GPYINPGRLGAQPAQAITATLDEVLRLHALAPIRVLTLAPEVPGHLALIGPLRDAGIRVQIGHSIRRSNSALSIIPSSRAAV